MYRVATSFKRVECLEAIAVLVCAGFHLAFKVCALFGLDVQVTIMCSL
ncbi:hypothetical protein APHCRT_0902 [Anaplasma phagocytophilum str. CRT53-1]|uniref:Uncharacterized protein n=2 Tax=Anaplasma phagocytophilum TaxID=948 RepID=A0A0F3PZK9_ANAPH|nr:hypothetical protein CRT38_03342 [Anaplasma phagocytophilum str. CRT38]KJV85825.1 hypothetical protein APHCRT_0902 [Anaplasma phagocytophilum str. CRT53-1]